MKRFLMVLLLLALAAPAMAVKPELPRDGAGQKVQNFAPDGGKTLLLTIASTPVDMTGDLGWQLYSPTACKYRLMPTAVKAGSALTVPVTTSIERRVNSATPFLNFTGCTNGELQRQ